MDFGEEFTGFRGLGLRALVKGLTLRYHDREL